MLRVRGRALILGAVVICGAAVLIGRDGVVQARGNEVRSLVALCNSPVGANRKLMALEKLRAKDTGEARAAINELSESDDPKLATAAIGVLCKSADRDAVSQLEDLLEDSGASDAARCAALGALCKIASDKDDAWTEVETAYDSEIDGNDALESMAKALKSKLFAGGAK